MHWIFDRPTSSAQKKKKTPFHRIIDDDYSKDVPRPVRPTRLAHLAFHLKDPQMQIKKNEHTFEGKEIDVAPNK